MSQTQKQKGKSKRVDEVLEGAAPQSKVDHTVTDDILAAIDATVEEMGQDFALGYFQKGGQ